MISAYKMIHEDENKIVYQFNTVSLYFLYVAVLVMISGFLYPQMYIAGAVLISIYFIFVSLPALQINRKINASAKEMGVKVSGNKYSFKNPLKFTLTK